MTINPGIERGMTATAQHHVESHLSIGMQWADAEALFITLDEARRTGRFSPAPSHEEAVNTLIDLLAQRIYVIRRVVTEPSAQ